MGVYPVVLCGGSGTRLWPASRASRPKAFLTLFGDRSLFQQTVLRVAPLASGGGRLIVVGGLAHRGDVTGQLGEIAVEAQVLLEPVGRDSAAAMAAAALWVARTDPDGVLAFVASDHHIPDPAAFRAAVRTAAEAARRRGRLVLLGVKPDGPSTAYGYIRPSGPGLSRVLAFAEKPDAAEAARRVAAGDLWNSGNFIVRARDLLAEIATFAPEVMAAVRASTPRHVRPAALLGPTFATAPAISIDKAVIERTRRASVLPVDFVWSDVGSWDLVAALPPGPDALTVLDDCQGCLVRAPSGVLVAGVGLRDVAIIVENDAVLVCDLSQAQGIKALVGRIGALSAGHVQTLPRPLRTRRPRPAAVEIRTG